MGILAGAVERCLGYLLLKYIHLLMRGKKKGVNSLIKVKKFPAMRESSCEAELHVPSR